MTSSIFFFLAITGLILRIIFSFLIPDFTGNDELAHLKYAQHIAAEKALPNLNNYKDEQAAGNEYFQPPVYYFLGSMFISTTENAAGQLHILRMLSIFLWAVGFYFTYKILKILKLPVWLSTSTLVFSSLLPTYVVNSSTATNDALSVPLTIVTIYYLLTILNKTVRYPQILILSALSGITILTKLNGFILIPATITAVYCTKDKNFRTFFLKTLLFLGTTSLITLWWFAYNKQVYGDLMGPIDASTAGFVKIPFSLQKIYLLLRGTFATFWVAYGPANEIRLPAFVYGILFIFSSLSIAGNIIYAGKIIKRKMKLPLNGKIVKILGIALASNLALHFAFNINQHQPLGRYLFLSLIQIALIFSLGIGILLTNKARNFLPVFLIGLFFILNIWGALILINS